MLFARWVTVLGAVGLVALLVAVALPSARTGGHHPGAAGTGTPRGSAAGGSVARDNPAAPVHASAALAGMPPVLNPNNIYSADAPNMLSPAVKGDVSMIYVPNSLSNTVSEINPATDKVVRTFRVAREPQHVVPSWDLKTLWVTSDIGNSLTPINPKNGLPGRPVAVRDPYNMYFTPNGKFAIVVAERYESLDFRNPQTMALVHALHVPCLGVDHMDFSANGTYLIASCEFGAKLIKVDVATQSYAGSLSLPAGSKPQDVKLSPNGKIFYVADMISNGVWMIDGQNMKVLGFIKTGQGAHGLYVSRNDRVPLRDQSRRGLDLGDLLCHQQGRAQMVDPRRRQPGHGEYLGQRQGPLGVGPLQLRRLRHRHRQRSAAPRDQGRRRAARLVRLAATGPLLARSHRDHALRSFVGKR